MLYILVYILLASSFLYGAELNIKKRPHPDSEEVQEPNKKIKTADSEYSDDDINLIIAPYYGENIDYKYNPLSDSDLLHKLIEFQAPLSLIEKVINHKPEYLDILDSDTDFTPLHTAAKSGSPEVIEYLISKRPGHLYEEKYYYCESDGGLAIPLFLAVQTFNFDGVATLLKYCDINYRNSIGEGVYKFLSISIDYCYGNIENAGRSDKDTKNAFLTFKAIYEANPKLAQDNYLCIFIWKKLSFLTVPYLIEKQDFLLLDDIRFDEQSLTSDDRKQSIWNEDILIYDKAISQLLAKYSANSKEIDAAIKVFSKRSPNNIVLSCLHNDIPIPKNITESFAVNLHEKEFLNYIKRRRIPVNPINKVIKDFNGLKKEIKSLIKTEQYENLQKYIDNFDELFIPYNNIYYQYEEEHSNYDDSDDNEIPYIPFLSFVFSYKQLAKIIIQKLEGQTQDALNFIEIVATQCNLADIRDENNNTLIFHAIKHDQQNRLFNRPDMNLVDTNNSLTLMLISECPELLTEAIKQSLSHFPLFEKLFYDTTSKHYRMPNYKERHDIAIKEERVIALEKERTFREQQAQILAQKKRELEKVVESFFAEDSEIYNLNKG